MRSFNDLCVVLCGGAGQGVQTIETLLTDVIKKSGYNVFATKEYMSRIRGGSNSTEIRISTQKKISHINRIDILIPLNKEAILHLNKRINADTIILGEKETLGDVGDLKIINVPFTALANEIGNKLFFNTIAVGVVLGILNTELEVLNQYLSSLFANKGEDIISKNINAGKKGFEIGQKISKDEKILIKIDKNDSSKNEILLSGSEALSLGAVAGGCDFISSYPMTPGSGVLQFMASNAEKFGVKVEQAEDEISAINMALGAWYAGGRAIVTTSGGGFALMVEGVSLAGMTETPVVIHLAQRPGPATGLPTRTEQGDLELALYSGHGEFPRIIFAPGTVMECFELMQNAFNLADKFQVPVFVLSDQYLVDSYYNIEKIDLSKYKIINSIVKTETDYLRYKITDTGISPRGIPGFGTGLVTVDSDEHYENGRITEDLDVRIAMNDKRLRKNLSIIKDIIEPVLNGPYDYKNLIIGWGSTFSSISEALQILDNKETAYLHFKQVYPLHPKTSEYIKRAKKTIIIENNATGQLAKLIKRETGLSIDNSILQYNGMPFAADLLGEKINELI